MKRRRFQSIALIPKCGYVAICEEGRGWVFTFDDPKWRMLFELPPIEEPPEATIRAILDAGLVTREEYVKDYDSRHGTDMAKFSENQALPITGAVGQVIGYGVTPGQGDGTGEFLDPSLGKPWPEDQTSDRPAISPEPTVWQDRSNLVAKIDRAERLLHMSCWKRAATNPCPDVTDIIDISFALKSLIEEIRNELGLPTPGVAA